MTEKSRFDQRRQKVGTQTNIEGDPKSPIFSGRFQVQGDFIYNEATKIRLPLMRPPRAKHFTGRAEELALLLSQLWPGRAVTICGPGGMGKTALSVEAIWQLAPGIEPPQRFPDGIIFHTFYHLPQAALALETFARAYGEDPRPSPYEAARRSLAGRQALIVLDGTETCDDLDTVLSVTASCGVLITTRRHSDAPADFKDLSPLPANESVRLLQAWAGTMASDEKICQCICGILGGLPLAIFLAGRYMAHKRQFGGEYLAWLEKTPLAALDMGEREHRSIPLLMKHSLEQLSDAARACLGVTGILALRPFQARIMAIALEMSTEDANHSLGELIDFGLLIRPDVSYQITHALVHTYARDKQAPPKNALAYLAEHYNSLVREKAKQGPYGYAILDGERDHILSVQFACNKAGLDKYVRTLTWAIEDYLDLQGRWVERTAVLQSGLKAARSDEDHYDEASFLSLLGLVYRGLGETSKAIEYHEQALKKAREIEDTQGEGVYLANLGLGYFDLGEIDKATEYYKQALKIAREIGDIRLEASSLANLGTVYSHLGETDKAIKYYRRAFKLFQEIGDRRGEGNALGNLGNAYSHLGETSKAIKHYERALKLFQEIGDRRGEGVTLCHLGLANVDLNETSIAIKHYEQALIIFRYIGNPRMEGADLSNLGNAYLHLGETSKAIEYYERALKIFREIGDNSKEVNHLGYLGNAYANLGKPRKAIEYYDQALKIAREIGDRSEKCNHLSNLGIAYKNLDKTEKAIKCHKQALRIAREIGDRRRVAIISWNLGLAYERKGDLKRAVNLMQDLVDFKRDTGHLDAEKFTDYLENLRSGW